MKRLACVCVAIGLIGAVAQAQLTGMVRYVTGTPAAGAFVKIKSADSRLIYVVVSDEQGRYSSPKLTPGKYAVQSLGGVYQSSALEVAVEGGGSSADLQLTALREIRVPPRSLTDAEYVALMPEGEGKQLLLTRCVVCHGPGNYVARPGTREDWEQRLNGMEFYLIKNHDIQLEYNKRVGLNTGPLTAQEKSTVIDYLTKNFSPENAPPIPPVPPPFGSRFATADPNQHFPMAAAPKRYIAMEMDISPASAGSFALDSHGVVWISEKTTGALGRLDPKSLVYTRLSTPSEGPTKDDFGAVGVDPHGMVWFTSTHDPYKSGLSDAPGYAKWYQYDPKSQKVVHEYALNIPAIPGGDILYNTFAFPPDGSVWVTSTAKHHVIKLEPATGKVTPFPMRIGQHTFGITVGGDKMIWYAGDNDNLIGRIDQAGKITTYSLPKVKSGGPFPSRENGQKKPWRLATDAEGNIWANTLAGTLMKTDYRTGKMTEFKPPVEADALGGLDVDLKNNIIWFSEVASVKIGRFDPAKNKFDEYPLTSAGQRPWITLVDPSNANRIWWNTRDGRIGYLEILN